MNPPMTDPTVERRSLLDIALDHAVDGDNNVVVFRLDAGGGDYDFAEIEVERP